VVFPLLAAVATATPCALLAVVSPKRDLTCNLILIERHRANRPLLTNDKLGHGGRGESVVSVSVRVLNCRLSISYPAPQVWRPAMATAISPDMAVATTRITRRLCVSACLALL
jgi:hypothetical protein